MKKNLQKYGLIYCMIWLVTGFLLSYLEPKNLLSHFYLGVGVLFTLYALKKLNFKIN
jgi:hypothetical protein